MRPLLNSVLTLSILVFVGCGGSSETKVTGTVTYKGKPLNSGYVLLKFENNNEVNGQILGDGTFEIYTTDRGKALIAVGSPKIEPVKETRGGPPVDTSKLPDPAKWVEIPAKYADPATSSKEVTIKSGINTVNIDLE